MKHVLLIDNFDSFTFNLAQAAECAGAAVTVVFADRVTPELALGGEFTHIMISPGPGRPPEAGRSVDIIRTTLGHLPLLGVCLGHQALAHMLGGTVAHARTLMHGKTSPVYHDSRSLFEGLPNPLQAGRYHSLAVQERGLPRTLEISAYTSDGEIMGIRHREFHAEGVQFHPESVLTPEGQRLICNFLEQSGGARP